MAESGSSDPCCLFAHCDPCEEIDQNQLIKDVTKQTDLPDYHTVIEDIVGFCWHFETKYYTCSVRICKTSKPTLGNRQFADQLEAVVLVFDPEKMDSWNKVNSWLSSYLEHLDPSVKLLVCNSCSSSNQVPKSTIQQWCMKNEFELIELEPTKADSDSEADEFEVEGVKRILQVLHAHTWPNLVMKDKSDTVSPYMRQLMKEVEHEEQAGANADKTNNKTAICSELGMHPDELHGLMHDEGEAGQESFEKLFSKFTEMKVKAQGLPSDERKSYAAKMAMSFLAALGGSDDEFDLEDSD